MCARIPGIAAWSTWTEDSPGGSASPSLDAPSRQSSSRGVTGHRSGVRGNAARCGVTPRSLSWVGTWTGLAARWHVCWRATGITCFAADSFALSFARNGCCAQRSCEIVYPPSVWEINSRGRTLWASSGDHVLRSVEREDFFILFFEVADENANIVICKILYFFPFFVGTGAQADDFLVICDSHFGRSSKANQVIIFCTCRKEPGVGSDGFMCGAQSHLSFLPGCVIAQFLTGHIITTCSWWLGTYLWTKRLAHILLEIRIYKLKFQNS